MFHLARADPEQLFNRLSFWFKCGISGRFEFSSVQLGFWECSFPDAGLWASTLRKVTRPRIQGPNLNGFYARCTALLQPCFCLTQSKCKAMQGPGGVGATVLGNPCMLMVSRVQIA